jgi:transcriptional antiterminator RfaH
MDLKWYVLRSKPNKELILWRELLARDVECFFPQLRVRPADPRSRKVQPYFPGYMFVHTDVKAVGVSAFQWMPFSNGLVSFDGEAALVPDSLVQALRRHVEQVNAAATPEAQLAGLKRGEKVLIEGGPFKGHEAIFDTRLPGRERVRVLLRLLQNRGLPVELPASDISSLRAPKKRR